MSDQFSFVEKEFNSIAELVEFASQFEGRGEHLFRGEKSDLYNRTLSTYDRVLLDRFLPEKCRDTILSCVEYLHQELQRFLKLPSELAMGFLQHYEVPTRMLDLTASAKIAACFSAGGALGSSGLFAIIPRTIRCQGDLLDLRDHPCANRPRRQHAFTFQSDTYGNLKSPEAIDLLGIRWFKFRHSKKQNDAWAAYAVKENLLDAHRDEVAGFVQLLIDEYGKMNDWSAKWLADHVATAPFITRITGQSNDGSLIVELDTAERAGLHFDDCVERFNNHRIWSNAYPDTRSGGGFQNLSFKNASREIGQNVVIRGFDA